MENGRYFIDCLSLCAMRWTACTGVNTLLKISPTFSCNGNTITIWVYFSMKSKHLVILSLIKIFACRAIWAGYIFCMCGRAAFVLTEKSTISGFGLPKRMHAVTCASFLNEHFLSARYRHTTIMMDLPSGYNSSIAATNLNTFLEARPRCTVFPMLWWRHWFLMHRFTVQCHDKKWI